MGWTQNNVKEMEMDIKIEYIPEIEKYRIWNERYVNYAKTRMEVVELIKKCDIELKPYSYGLSEVEIEKFKRLGLEIERIG